MFFGSVVINNLVKFKEVFSEGIEFMANGREIKICFAASSGGHYEQLLMLKPLMKKYESFIITEETLYNSKVAGEKMYYMKQVNRKEKTFIPYMIVNLFRSIRVFLKEKPDVVICTGVLAMIPICLIAKTAGKKLIYIESFAKVTSATQSGKLLYKFADKFYVQWPQMLEIYPKAIYLGGIY
jgi:UDP-N-acetylglucosamine:LPS N-acetylglucosamine transferase